MTKSQTTYDAIIIGAGISGLVCGCYLAKAGMKVLIVEQHDKPGGYFTSFKRKGFLFDSAAHSFGNYREGGHVYKIFTELGVDKIIKIERFDPSDIIIAPDFTMTFWNDKDTTLAGLATLFPQEKDNLKKFFDFLMSSNQAQFSTLKSKTFESLLRSFFRDEKLISSFAIPVFGNGGLPPSLMHAFSGSKIFSEFIIDGGYYPEGGIQNMPNAFDYIIKENHGKILYRTLVNEILVTHDSVVGVKLENNVTLSSKYVISACDMNQTYTRLLRETIPDKQRIESLKNMVPSISTFILYIGINKPFAGLPPPGTNTWYLPHYDLDEIYSQIQQCNFGKAGMYMFRVSPDQKTLLAFVGAPFMNKLFWKENKKKVADNFLNRIETLFPNIRENIVYFDAATPHTLYRYTLNSQGAAFGWAKTTSQTYDALFSKTTGIRGLYLTGHWTSIAFGMPGTCYSGHDTAKRILRKEKMK
ncbi:MAG: phytoene desaturase family protein [Nitrospirota bacterium]